MLWGSYGGGNSDRMGLWVFKWDGDEYDRTLGNGDIIFDVNVKFIPSRAVLHYSYFSSCLLQKSFMIQFEKNNMIFFYFFIM